MRIAVFHPTNIRENNAFDIGEAPAFDFLAKNRGYHVDLFVDAENSYPNRHPHLGVRTIRRSKIGTKLAGARLRMMGWAPYPYYPGVIGSLKHYDVLIGEGALYSLNYYLFEARRRNPNIRIILHDSLTYPWRVGKATFKHLKSELTNTDFIFVNPTVRQRYLDNELIEEHSSNRYVCVGHVVDMKNIHPRNQPAFKPAERPLEIVSVGRLVPEKGFDIILKALSLLQSEGWHTRLTIIGSGPSHGELVRLATTLKIDDDIHFAGSKSHSDLLAFLPRFDLFVSHPLQTHYIEEAFCLANMEALATGLPVISTKCGGVPFATKGYAHLVDQKDISGLAEAIRRFFYQPELINSMGKQGQAYVAANFSAEQIANKYDEVISIRSLGIN